MSINIKAYANCDEVTIVWRCAAPIAGCRGFALHRQTRTGTGPVVDTAVETWVGFADGPQAQSGIHKSSTAWPIQRYLWSDYFVGPADAVRYQVVPMLGAAGSLKPSGETSDWSDWVEMKTGQTPGLSAWFNHGIIASQWVARALQAEGAGPKASLDQSIKDPANPLRTQLGGPLRQALLDLLARSAAAGEMIYAALYELNDPELIPALKAFGKKGSLILGSGAYKAGEPDENADARADLTQSDTIVVFDRLVKSPHFAHNKFVVFCDAGGRPLRLWTGSTNWTVTGLCTQVNNGLLVDDPGIAAVYLQRWQALRDAGSAYPPGLALAGSTPGRSQMGSAALTSWNAPVQGLVDLADARRLIQGARQGVLFLMFNPGPAGTLLNDILALNQQNLFIHGVVNQDPGGSKGPILTLHDRGNAIDADPEVALPDEIKAQVKGWFGDEYRGNMVMVHSKVVVIDPFGSHPVVMTGSHNLGPKASGQNDDNLMIVENAPGLAAEYAVHILGVYGHYKFRHNRKLDATGRPTWKGLQDDDQWQAGYFVANKRREIDFWFGDLVPEPVAG